MVTSPEHPSILLSEEIWVLVPSLAPLHRTARYALDDGAWRKEKKMISHITLTDIRESTRLVETTANDIEALTQGGYAEDEILSLLWLRQHYQSGGSDRGAIVRSLEFLRYLVMSGKLEA
jgi:hypothetical protein